VNLHRFVNTIEWLVMVATLSAAVMLFTLGGRESLRNVGNQPDQSLIAEGTEVYTTFCQACHGPIGQGGTGPALAGDLIARFPDANVQRVIILTGPNAMPSFAVRLTDRQIDAVVAFTRYGL